jgi:hypothetical protein
VSYAWFRLSVLFYLTTCLSVSSLCCVHGQFVDGCNCFGGSVPVLHCISIVPSTSVEGVNLRIGEKSQVYPVEFECANSNVGCDCVW